MARPHKPHTSARSAAAAAATTSGWRWAVLGAAIGIACALILFAPARWLASGLALASQGHLKLTHARGTVWNGTAGLVFASGAGGVDSISLPGPLSWTLRPRWNGFTLALDIPCCTASPLELKGRPRADGFELEWGDGQSRWPAALLTGFGAPWNTLKPEGVLDLSTQALRLQWQGAKLHMEGRATLDATDLSSSLSTLKPMGSYRITLEGGAQPSLLLSTREGSLQLSGSGRWSGTAMRFDGEASAAPGREDALANLLNIIGRREGKRSLITLG